MTHPLISVQNPLFIQTCLYLLGQKARSNYRGIKSSLLLTCHERQNYLLRSDLANYLSSFYVLIMIIIWLMYMFQAEMSGIKLHCCCLLGIS